jgi:hypothetical protein
MTSLLVLEVFPGTGLVVVAELVKTHLLVLEVFPETGLVVVTELVPPQPVSLGVTHLIVLEVCLETDQVVEEVEGLPQFQYPNLKM